MKLTKRQRIKLRSRKYNDMRPHIFDKLLYLLPHTLCGVQIPAHYDNLPDYMVRHTK